VVQWWQSLFLILGALRILLLPAVGSSTAAASTPSSMESMAFTTQTRQRQAKNCLAVGVSPSPPTPSLQAVVLAARPLAASAHSSLWAAMEPPSTGSSDLRPTTSGPKVAVTTTRHITSRPLLAARPLAASTRSSLCSAIKPYSTKYLDRCLTLTSGPTTAVPFSETEAGTFSRNEYQACAVVSSPEAEGMSQTYINTTQQSGQTQISSVKKSLC